MLVHGFTFDDLLISSIVPIPKGKTVLSSDSSNYRALSSIFGKVFDRIVINRYYDLLASSALQFGLKKETLSYYAANRGNVYYTLLDATKAFDRVNYCLVNRKLPRIVLRLLDFMYTNHNSRFLWNGVQSRWFGVMNGVKQGGVLSPYSSACILMTC